MKEIRNVFVTASLCMALLWWGMLFPEMLLDEATVTITDEIEKTQMCIEAMECAEGKSIRDLLLEADTEQIVYKSKLMELYKEYFDEVTDNDDT